MRLTVPEEGLIEFPNEDVRVQDAAPLIETLSVALLPEFTEKGPDSEAVAPFLRLTTATASSPGPHEVDARPEYAELELDPTARLPDAGRKAPMPSTVTLAAGSEACHEIVTNSPAQTLPREALMLSEARGQTRPPPIPTARRRTDGGGGFGWNAGVKSIPVTG